MQFSLLSTFFPFSDNELYSGTVADFSGLDPIIYREPLQTEQYDSLSLNGNKMSLIYVYVAVNATHVLTNSRSLFLKTLARLVRFLWECLRYRRSARRIMLRRNLTDFGCYAARFLREN